MDNQLYGDHETQMSEGGEADLHRYLTGCKKNPGHTEFIPVDAFTLNHLPEDHRDTDLYELIKVIADLTVRVAVKIISPNRPEFWPNTKVPYPFQDKIDNAMLRTGSGIIWRVFKFTDGYKAKDGCKHEKNFIKCWCRRCQNSDTASNVWWEFNVYTATQVVFDNTEASQTSLRFFYDREESPLIIVDQVIVDDANIKRDCAVLKCVTCDQTLGEKLDILCTKYADVWVKVRAKYRKSADVDRLNFIVSHLHGCSKMVSIGRWIDKYWVGEYNKFTYTTSTCPGSSGAIVFCVGYRVGWWGNQLVHSGSINSKFNYSGTGYVW